MDQDLHARIASLVEEEHALRAQSEDLREPERARLRRIEESLDRTWDLLRQRQALRDAGQDPGQAHERSADVVEGYWS